MQNDAAGDSGAAPHLSLGYGEQSVALLESLQGCWRGLVPAISHPALCVLAICSLNPGV